MKNQTSEILHNNNNKLIMEILFNFFDLSAPIQPKNLKLKISYFYFTSYELVLLRFVVGALAYSFCSFIADH